MEYQKQAQEGYSLAPTIILGSGASIAYGICSMGELATHLIDSISTLNFSQDEQAQWTEFCALLNDNVDLETALHRVVLSDVLTNLVVEETWNLINPQDLSIFDDSLNNQIDFPLGTLIKSMFRSAHTRINIITTNYDRLAEYACDKEGFLHFSGFSYGYLKRLTDSQELRPQRLVNIWKVHGSLDWFKTPLGDTCALGNISTIPSNHSPQIVTPGTEKYRLTHREPYRSIIHKADDAILSANSYLCIGFGFNDEHIQEKLIEKCVRSDAHITVVTHTLSDAAKSFLFDSNVRNYLAIERGRHDDESVIHSSLSEEPISVDANYWSLSGFLNLIL